MRIKIAIAAETDVRKELKKEINAYNGLILKHEDLVEGLIAGRKRIDEQIAMLKTERARLDAKFDAEVASMDEEADDLFAGIEELNEDHVDQFGKEGVSKQFFGEAKRFKKSVAGKAASYK